MSQPMKMPFFDIVRQTEPLKGQIMAEFEKLVSKGAFIGGEAVSKFETEVAKWIGVKHAITVSSGTDALIAALRVLGVGHGDEVITPAYSFFASTGSILNVGATPVFVDIEPKSFNIDVSKIEAAITSKTKAIMPVHLYGQCADMEAIMEIANRKGLFVLEDYAQSIGAKDQGKPAGAIGHMGATSFYPTKNLGGAGDGGLVTTNDDKLAEATKLMRAHGMPRRYYHDVLGFNYRLDSLQTAYLNIKLPHLNAWVEKRTQIASRYTKELAPLTAKGLVLPTTGKGKHHVWNQYTIRVRDRDGLKARLAEQGIPTEIYYPLTIPEQKIMRGVCNEKGWPESERAAKEVLALPIFPELRDEEQTLVIQALLKSV